MVHRFGEDDEEISHDDKMMARFQKERMKRLKKERYNLDSDNEEDQLTHGGVALGDAIDFAGEDIMSDDEEDHRKAYSDADVAAMNFGGGVLAPGAKEGDDGETRTKTRKEIMEEVIAKSKKFKAERKKAAEEDEAAISKLDDDWAVP